MSSDFHGNGMKNGRAGALTRRQRAATIMDVTRLAGVSVSTVSRAIRGRDDVSENT